MLNFLIVISKYYINHESTKGKKHEKDNNKISCLKVLLAGFTRVGFDQAKGPEISNSVQGFHPARK